MKTKLKIPISKSVQVKKVEDDTTFNKLLELQTLLKKESALKELFIKTGKETQNNIEDQCIEIYEKKIEVLNILEKLYRNKNQCDEDETSKKKNNSQNELLNENILIKKNYDYLQEINIYVENLLNYLWEDPKLVADLLMISDKEDTKKYLAPLICNNFYENILSSNFIEDHLMYIIYLLLYNEINSMEDIKDCQKFLNETQCGYLIGQLIEKKDVKDYFKLVLQNILEDIGTNKFYFDSNEIQQTIVKKRKTINKQLFQKDLQKTESIKEKHNSEHLKNPQDNSFLSARTFSSISTILDDEKKLIKDNENYQLFSAKYLMSLTLNELKKKINETEDVSLKNYYEYILLNADNDKNAYSQDNFINSISEKNDSEVALIMYQQDFIKVTEFIDKLFQNLISNYRIVPYAIKCICKMIYHLVMNRFPNANNIEKNIFISKFFFDKLLTPMLLNPDINALINNYIISNNITRNAKLISQIISTFVSFKLYKNIEKKQGQNYTPFNVYFMENIPQVFKFYEKIIKVKLPSFIDKLINNDISIDEYNFDYFKENPNEVLFHRSMLLNIYEFNAIFKNISKYQEELFSIKKDKGKEKKRFFGTIFKGNKDKDKNKSKEENKEEIKENLNNTKENKYKKLILAIKRIESSDNNKFLQDLVKRKDYSKTVNENKEDKKSKKKEEEVKKNVYYFHISKLLFNEKYKKIFSLEQKNPYYHIEEVKESPNQKLSKNELATIVKAKNFLSSILYNYRVLVKTDFNEGTTNETIDILKELKLFMKSSNFLIDGNIPSEWYISDLLECLKKLPREYHQCDYEKLYDELKEELIDSIKKYNFEHMSIFIDKMKFAKRNKVYFNKTKEIYLDIELNNKANNIIEDENYPLNIYIYFNFKNKREFSIYKEGLKEKQLNFLDSFAFKDNHDRGKLCKTIEQFTRFFPNFNKRISLQGKACDENEIAILEIQKQLEIPKKLKLFFGMVSDHLKKIIKNENEINTINNKIYDYVMSKIYKRIYPKDKHIYDDIILQKLCKLSWVEPQHIIKDKHHFDFDLILPDINNFFNSIRNEKSARKKLINLNNIFSSINQLLKFSGVSNFGVDDQIPVLTYCFIKSRPKLIYSDCKFMKLYIGDKKNKGEDNQLTQMMTVCDFVKDADWSSFFNIEEKDYIEKCQECFTEYMDNYLEI